MTQWEQKLQNLRIKLRRDQLNEMMNQKRTKLILLEKYQKQSMDWMDVIDKINQSITKITNHNQAKELENKYPVQIFINFLDNSELQLPIIKIIFSYFYFKALSKLSQPLFNKLLQILFKTQKIETVKWVFLVLNQVTETSNLIRQSICTQTNIMHNLCILVAKNMNEEYVVLQICRLIHFSINSTCNESIVIGINLLFKMIDQSINGSATHCIQTLYQLAKNNQSQYMLKKLYDKGLLTICMNTIRHFQVRSTSYHFLKFVKMFITYLKQGQVKDIIKTIQFMRSLKFKIGSNNKYSIKIIKTNAYSIIINFLLSQQKKISQIVRAFFNLSLIISDLHQYFYDIPQYDNRLQILNSYRMKGEGQSFIDEAEQQNMHLLHRLSQINFSFELQYELNQMIEQNQTENTRMEEQISS